MTKEIECRFSDKGGFGFADAADGSGSYFIAPDDTKDAMTGDTVLVHPFMEGEAGYTKGSEGMILRILRHANEEITGHVAYWEGRLAVLPENVRLHAVITTDAREIAKLPVGTLVSVRILTYGARQESRVSGAVHLLSGDITEVFGERNSIEANYAAVLHEYRIPTAFPEAVLDESLAVSKETIKVGKRLDLRDTPILTIDNETAKDLDDAVSLQKTETGYTLGVHIADVSHYVTENSETDYEAYDRGTSVYFVDQVVPMLPPILSNGVCSLNAGEDRYTVSALISLSEAGEILSYEFRKAVIRSRVRGVYSEVNDIFENGNASVHAKKYAEVLPMLGEMKTLYEVLKRAADARGQFNLTSSEAVILLDADGKPEDIVPATHGTAEDMIEQFMLTANTAAARFLTERGLPCLYRVHENPPADKIQSFAALASNLGLDTAGIVAGVSPARLGELLAQAKEKGVDMSVSNVLLRSLAKAKYSEKHAGHYGLALETYCHFTSPIRRYPDLFVHRAISHAIAGTKLPIHPSETARLTTEAEIRATGAERKIESMFMAQYAAAHAGDEFDGTIVSVTNYGVYVRTEKCFEGFVPVEVLFPKWVRYDFREETQTLSGGLNYMYRIGMPLHVRIDRADPITGEITLAPCGESEVSEDKPPRREFTRREDAPHKAGTFRKGGAPHKDGSFRKGAGKPHGFASDRGKKPPFRSGGKGFSKGGKEK